MKAAILTMFSGLSSTYSLVNVVADQIRMLLDAGVILASSSTNTGLLAREFICKGEEA